MRLLAVHLGLHFGFKIFLKKHMILFLFSFQISVASAILVALVFGVCVESLPQDVPCTINPDEPTTCYIATPIYLLPGNTLNIVNRSDLVNVTRFELRAFTNLIQIPPIIWAVFPNLQELVMADYASVATLTTVDFLYASKLKLLNLRGNKVTTILQSTFALAGALEKIDLSYNLIGAIEDLAFIGLDNLKDLNLSNNKIGTLKVFTLSNLKNLETLDLGNNKIKLIDDGALALPKLKLLNFNSNDVKLLPDNLFGLTPSTLPPLTYVDFGENKLSHIGNSFYGLSELNSLNLTGNKKIDDINLALFAELPKLETLFLSSSGFQFPTVLFDETTLDVAATPVPTSASPLKKLYLAKNKLVNPDVLKQLAYFGQLEVLSLEENRFIYLDDVDSLSTWFPKLHTLFIGENKLSCDWLNQTLPLFDASNVRVYTIKKVKSWFGTTYQKKLIDMDDCFDLGKIFDNILFFLNKFSRAV